MSGDGVCAVCCADRIRTTNSTKLHLLLSEQYIYNYSVQFYPYQQVTAGAVSEGFTLFKTELHKEVKGTSD
jgi:hypothetical protein